jgi:hypothetical protein
MSKATDVAAKDLVDQYMTVAEADEIRALVEVLNGFQHVSPEGFELYE